MDNHPCLRTTETEKQVISSQRRQTGFPAAVIGRFERLEFNWVVPSTMPVPYKNRAIVVKPFNFCATRASKNLFWRNFVKWGKMIRIGNTSDHFSRRKSA
jgi:hypothetical protein